VSYAFEDLMTIRRYRVKLALNQMLQLKKVFDDAKIAKEKIEEELSAYIIWRKNEEVRLFLELKNSFKRINHLHCYNQCLDAINEKENIIKERLRAAVNYYTQAESDLIKAKFCYDKCNHQKLKLEEHRAVILREKKIACDRSHDNEMDEISVISFNAQVRN
jgi:hypothetical protein